MAILGFYDDLTARLKAAGDYVWPTALRLIMFWEFWEAGIKKYHGDNWFANIPWADWQKGFPWPFSAINQDLNWFLATWGELVFAFLILFGLFTRFAALSLIVITAVATAAVHWPAQWDGLGALWEGYVITAKDAGNYKLPLLFLLLLMPLLFHGGGKLSLDHLLLKITGRTDQIPNQTGDLQAAGMALAVLGIAAIWLEPSWGIPLLLAGGLAIAVPMLKRSN